MLLAALAAVAAIAGCGSSVGSSESAQSLLRQTFSSSHTVRSGTLTFGLSADPSGSSTITTPISLSLSGPFQSRGAGKLPASDFTVGITALGRRGSLGVISTGTAGYVSLQGSDYTLPASEFQRLESGFSSIGSSGSSGGLGALGIDPQRWLRNPQIVGTATVGGAPTTHVRADVQVTALLSDLNTFLTKTKSSSSSSTTIAPATEQKIAATVRNATVDVWTGSSDHLLRRLTLSLVAPITGQTSTTLGGMTSAGIDLTIQYADLNQPQTITAPSHALPYSQLNTKLRSIVAEIEGAAATTSSSSGAASSGAASGTSGASSSAQSKYTQCIAGAGKSIAKMQRCASLLG